MFKIKRISKEAAPAALSRAERYRLLNEPVEAESICLDVLEADPDNQQAIVTLLLALTDQFETNLSAAFPQAQALLGRLHDEYGRAYYEGVICERKAKAQFKRGGPHDRFAAYELFRRAMELYEEAEAHRPPDNDESILRWNTCVRILQRHRELAPRPDEPVEQMLE